MNRCVIIGGADISRYDVIRGYLEPDDFIICCDSGLRHRDGLGIQPHLIVGDFDSHENPCLPAETIVLPREKDDTDTVYAAKEGAKRGFKRFLLTGVMGGRLDHTLGNVSILLYLDSLGLEAVAADDYSEIETVSKNTAYISDSFLYFSLLNITGKAKGITVTNAKYPIDNGEITCEYQYGISNEVLKGQTASVSVREGRLLLIKIREE